eukprot:TRINITY_DN621_c0_g2_i4.p1 TRINITY_DN621_c0_g2~~TRINITY_DN621_c0_g2_i4.p1  ORF type:complete len:450 (+),score=119.35 TRINITY_DN621_c0_g2_i4:63-1412(+)
MLENATILPTVEEARQQETAPTVEATAPTVEETPVVQVVGHSTSRVNLAKKILDNVGGCREVRACVDVEGSEWLLRPVPTVIVVELGTSQASWILNKVVSLKSPLLILAYGEVARESESEINKGVAGMRMETEHKVPILFQKQSSTDPKGVEEMFEYFMSLVKSGASPVPYNANHQSDFAVVNRKLSPSLQAEGARDACEEDERWVFDTIASETSIGDVWFSNGKEGEWRPQSRVVVDMHVVHFTDLNREYFDTVVCGEKQVLARVVAVVGATKDDVRVLEKELCKEMTANVKFLCPEETLLRDFLDGFSFLDISKEDSEVDERILVLGSTNARTLRRLLLDRAGHRNSTVRLVDDKDYSPVKDLYLPLDTKYFYSFRDTFKVGDMTPPLDDQPSLKVVEVDPLDDSITVADAENSSQVLFCCDPSPSKLPFGVRHVWSGLTWAFSKKA